jgi:hypothetical protein
MPFRLKRSELLSLKLTLCARLGERESVHCIPPLTLREGGRLRLRWPEIQEFRYWSSGQTRSLHVGEAPV